MHFMDANAQKFAPKAFVILILAVAALRPLDIAGQNAIKFYTSLPTIFLIILPAFALSLLVAELRLVERFAIAASAGLIMVPVVAFIGSKMSIQLGWPAVIVPAIPAIIALWKMRRRIVFSVDYWDALAIFMAVVITMNYAGPVLKYPVPFGASDAAFHWSVSDTIAETGLVFEKYPSWSTIYPNQLYGQPPAVHVGSALLARLVGDTGPVPFFTYYGLIAGAFTLGTFVLVRRFAGPIAALGSTVVAMTVNRFGIVMFYGQWPSLASLAMLPVALLVARLYLQNPDRRHAVLLGLLLGLSAWAHTLIAVQNVIVVGLYVLLEALRARRLPKNLLLVALCFTIGLPVFFLPQATENVPNQALPLYLIYPPSESEGRVGSYPGWWVDPMYVYGPAVLLTASIGCIVFWKRRRDDLMPLSFALSLFILYHLPWLSNMRIMRFVIAEGLLFAILAGLGITVFEYFRQTKRFGESLAIVLLVCLMFYQTAWSVLIVGGYSPEDKLTPKQFELLTEMRTLSDGSFAYFGFTRQETDYWLQLIARRTMTGMNVNATPDRNFLYPSIPKSTQYIVISNSTIDSQTIWIYDTLEQGLQESRCLLLYSNSEGRIFELNCTLNLPFSKK